MQRSRVFGVQAGALIEQRHFDVLDDRVLGEQIVRLKNEAEVLAADFGKLIVVHVGDIFVAEVIFAGRGAIETAEQVEQRRFAGAGRPHQGDEIPLREIQRHAVQGAHRHRFQVIVLDQVDDAGDRRFELKVHGESLRFRE